MWRSDGVTVFFRGGGQPIYSFLCSEYCGRRCGAFAILGGVDFCHLGDGLFLAPSFGQSSECL